MCVHCDRQRYYFASIYKLYISYTISFHWCQFIPSLVPIVSLIHTLVEKQLIDRNILAFM